MQNVINKELHVIFGQFEINSPVSFQKHDEAQQHAVTSTNRSKTE